MPAIFIHRCPIYILAQLSRPDTACGRIAARSGPRCAGRVAADDNGVSGFDCELAHLDAHPIEVRLYNPFNLRGA